MLGSVEVRGMTRSAFIVRGALAAGGMYGAGAVAPIVSRALAAGGGGDQAVLSFALTLEQLEAAFYKQALTVPGLGPDLLKVLHQIAEHENEHVKQLSQTLQLLGATAAPAPKTNFPKLTGRKDVLGIAVALEDTGVGAYNGAAALLQSKDLLVAAGSIVQVEARHAGALRELAGMDPSVGAFDRALSRAEVLKRIKPVIKG
jgi:rubrerythrin